MSEFFKALERAEHDRMLKHSRRSNEQPAPDEQPVTVAPTVATPPLPETRARTEGPPAVVRSMPTRFPDAPSTQRGRPEPSEAHDEGWGEVEEHLVSLLDPTSPDAEQYRALRHVVEQSYGSGGPSVLAVSSPTVGDGKTTTAINLAGALAQDRDAAVLLVDADLRRGSAGSRLGLKDSRERGLVDAILDPSITLENVVRHRSSFNLSVVPAGHLTARPYEMLKSPRLGQLLDEARRRYQFIVLDTPPIVVAQDCRVISKWVDGFLLVVAADRTPSRLVEEALNRMEPDKIIGFVFNHEPQSLSYYYAGRYAASSNDHRADGWRRAVTKAAGSVRQRFAL
jgi:capsular exopolysaccharide synthesis family protein